MPNAPSNGINKYRLTLARSMIGLVLFFNLQCSFLFLIKPDWYSPGFELYGEVGERMVQALGVLFLMWNVPYAVALSNPIRHTVSLIEALVMQAIGVIGESILLSQLRGDYQYLPQTIQRFIWFDAGGLVLLILAAAILWPWRINPIGRGNHGIHQPDHT